MSKAEMLFFWITICAYVLATLFYLYWLVSGQTKGQKAERFIVWAGFLANTEVLIARTLTSGHLPVRTLYEVNITVAWLAVGVFLWVSHVYPRMKTVGLVSISFAFLVMGWGFADSPGIEPLTAAYKSNWLVVHVLFALLSTACYVFATGTSIMYLLQDRSHDSPSVSRFRQLPDLPALEKISVRLVLLGFLAATIMLLSGSIWAKLLWGKYWGWDPVETWSLVSWLIYGIYLHLRFTYGWRSRKLAWLCLGCLVTNIISLWAVGLVTPETYHSLELITRPADWY